MGISNPVPSRPGFVMERKSQRADCGIALHGGAVTGGGTLGTSKVQAWRLAPTKVAGNNQGPVFQRAPGSS